MAEGGRERGRERNTVPTLGSAVPTVEAIAGALANAIRRSFTTEQTSGSQPAASPRPGYEAGSQSADPLRPPAVWPTTTPESRHSLPSTSSRSAPSLSSRPSTYERASDFRVSKRPKYSAPTLFENWRNRRSRRQGQPAKIVAYDRDVILLPKEFKGRGGDVSIPRSTRRNKLGQAGLVGKIELNSNMSDDEVRMEICQVFAVPMGLVEEDLKSGRLFPFSYLQRTGAGSRSLCLPAVKESFEWSGKKVASLCKAGGYIYLLAGDELPGWKQLTKRELSSSSSEEGDEHGGEYSGDDLPDFSEQFGQHSSNQSDDVIYVGSTESFTANVSTLTDSTASTQSAPQPLSHSAIQPTSAPQQPSHSTTQPTSAPQPPSHSAIQPTSAPQPFSHSAIQPTSASQQPSHSTIQPTSAPQQHSHSTPLTLDPDLPSPSTSTQYSPPSEVGLSQSDGSVLAPLDQLLATFVGTLSAKQVSALYDFSGYDSKRCSNCLLHGPTLGAILEMINDRFLQYPKLKVSVDFDDMWADMVGQYKSPNMYLHSRLRIILDGKPSIDTGGVRRQVYSSVFDNFAHNHTIRLFDGPENHLRPVCTAEARSSGLLKILGVMIAHSICQDGIGFPYLSPTCYWYMVGGEEKALQFATVQDLPADSAMVISQINAAKDKGDIADIMQSSVACEVFQRCGITQVLQMSNKDVIGQEVLLFDAIASIAKLLDQMSDGLRSLGVLRVMRVFPDLFLHLFTYTACVTSSDVKEAVYIDEEKTDVQPGDTVVMSHLYRFIEDASEEVLKKFLTHCTGSTYPHPNSIRVDFLDGDNYGAISAHTCDKLIMFPRGVFTNESYQLFYDSLMAVTGVDTFNMV